MVRVRRKVRGRKFIFFYSGVSVKPFFNKEPTDATALIEESVKFQCKVEGDPTPNIIWRKDDGKLPSRRAHTLEDHSLMIEHVSLEDEGIYICDAENVVGKISARASLTVHCKFKYRIRLLLLLFFYHLIKEENFIFKAPPTFIRKPQNQKVGLNGIATFECVAKGNPPPSVFWTKEGSQVRFFFFF